MKNKGLVFEKTGGGADGEYCAFTFSISGGAEEYLSTIKALINVVGGVNNEFCNDVEKFYVCSLIEGMLPTLDQIQMIERSQQQ